ncbi:thrombospondin type 3 repeat-containing protein [Candidatus Uhrbacteria bacterium]|nr:thrombospondin type 3 repeat-containing protein [Candidatus Uhrbacteria bacterium]
MIQELTDAMMAAGEEVDPRTRRAALMTVFERLTDRMDEIGQTRPPAYQAETSSDRGRIQPLYTTKRFPWWASLLLILNLAGLGALAWKTQRDEATVYNTLAASIGNQDRYRVGVHPAEDYYDQATETWMTRPSYRNTLWGLANQYHRRLVELETFVDTYERAIYAASRADFDKIDRLTDDRFLNVLRPWLEDDWDRDGIPNEQDRCPDMAVLAEEISSQPDTTLDYGCPQVDVDDDGVPNYRDACPTEAHQGL